MGATTTIRQLWTDALRIMIRIWQPLLMAEVVIKFVSLLVFGPVSVVLLHVLLAGRTSVGNAALIGFSLSPVGIATIILIPTLLVGGILIEQCCLMALMFDAGAGRIPRAGRALTLTLLRIPRILTIALLQILTCIGVVAPLLLIGGLTFWLLLSDADINFYLETKPPKFMAAATIGAVLGLTAIGLLLLVYVRMFMAIPVCLSEGTSARESLRQSAMLARTHRRQVVWTAIGSFVVRLVAVELALLMLAGANRVVLSGNVEHRDSLMWIVAFVMAVDGIVLAIVATFDRAGVAAVVVLLFRELSPDHSWHSPVEPAITPRRIMWGRVGLIASILLALGLTTFHTFLLTREFKHRRHIGVTAHRAGAMHAPENSLSALRGAIAAGAESAEIDVQRSSDGVVMVVHDRDLNRLAGVPMIVGQTPLEQLRTADVGSRVAPEFAGERLATLDEFIDAARGQIRLSIELKYYGSGDSHLAAAVAQLLDAKGFVEHCDVISLEYKGLAQTRKINPHIRLGYLVSASIGELTRLDIDFLSVSTSVLNRSLRNKADKRGLTIACWTVNKRDDMIRMIVAGADDLVTDNPTLAVETIQWYQERSDPEIVLLHFREWWRSW